ncbi:type II toxin-antitoxin system RelB/DinJ family antitoxin [Secundilactobacillus kimchicus]|uniref:type II toxin-antitoxin system RelB/DinJ family antitoxin n=1 Tax=Secundilactobacillus kimchicus TaxID=528209 RepID=UPI001C039D01|nr:type II toxin-antitoxin system RelB/DinJ family antitoxin [Secundilactobacillus kimchicus]MBT9671646.1 type II toxin-antitoxin system RelB/DinJ family antitoxin [Secundilactobacillus kimchicus]
MTTSQVHFRMDEQEKEALEVVLRRRGLTLGEAFRLFAKKTIEKGGLPFEVSQPNLRLQKAIKSRDYIEISDPEAGVSWLNH